MFNTQKKKNNQKNSCQHKQFDQYKKLNTLNLTEQDILTDFSLKYKNAKKLEK